MGKEKFFLILILVLGLGLRLINLNQSFWLDEASQAVMSSQEISRIWSSRAGDFHPPLFYVLAHFWQSVNSSDLWLRLLPVSFGVLNILVIYLLAEILLPQKRLTLFRYSFSAGTISAFLLAVNNFHVYYSQEYRSYSLVCLLGTLSMYLLYRQKYLWLTLVNALLLYTHYSSVFLILTQLLIVIVTAKSETKTYLLSLGGSVILYSPWLPQFYRQLTTGINIDTYLPGWRQVLSVSPFKALPLIFFKLVAGRINLLPQIIYALYIIFVLGVTFISFLLPARHKTYLFMWVFIPVFTMLLVSLALPQNQPFRVIYILPGIILLFTQACMKFPKLFLTIFIYIAVVGNLAYFTRPRLQREQWHQMLSFVAGHPAPLVLKFSAKFSPLVWYAPRLTVISPVKTFPATSGQVSPILLNQISGLHNLYLLNYLTDLTDPSRVLDSALQNSGWQLTHTYNFEGVGFLYNYSKP